MPMSPEDQDRLLQVQNSIRKAMGNQPPQAAANSSTPQLGGAPLGAGMQAAQQASAAQAAQQGAPLNPLLALRNPSMAAGAGMGPDQQQAAKTAALARIKAAMDAQGQ